VTFCLLVTTAKQFCPPKLQNITLIVAIVQFAVYAIAVLLVDSFAVVIVNYVPVMILLLVMSCISLRSGRGSSQMIAGILILFAASGLQAAGVNVFMPLDRNGLYHVVSMVGVAYLYLGGVQLITR
jgi:hypothetical protein